MEDIAPRAPEDAKLYLLTLVAERGRAELLEACARAVRCLEMFAAQARRELEYATADASLVTTLPGKVTHACVWGAANAAAELNNATGIVAGYVAVEVALEERAKAAARAAP